MLQRHFDTEGETMAEPPPLTEIEQYFRLAESRAEGAERSALKMLKHNGGAK